VPSENVFPSEAGPRRRTRPRSAEGSSQVGANPQYAMILPRFLSTALAVAVSMILASLSLSAYCLAYRFVRNADGWSTMTVTTTPGGKRRETLRHVCVAARNDVEWREIFHRIRFEIRLFGAGAYPMTRSSVRKLKPLLVGFPLEAANRHQLRGRGFRNPSTERCGISHIAKPHPVIIPCFM
jgi:hypothetical protein